MVDRRFSSAAKVDGPKEAPAEPPQTWLRLPLQPVTNTIASAAAIERVEYHLHFGKEARGWRNLCNFARGRPSLPNLRSVYIIVDGSALDKLTVAQCRNFRLAADLIGPIGFRVERLEVVYLPHRRTAIVGRPGEPDEGTCARDEVQELVVRNVAKMLPFGCGKVVCDVENEMWPYRKVVDWKEEQMRLVYTCGRWE